MPELSQETKNLIEKYQDQERRLEKKITTSVIHVDEVVLKIASFYQKLRETLSWKEEHLIKNLAIRKILKRKLLLGQERKTISESILLELIESGYFPNDQIEEKKASELEKILNKYIYILKKNNKGLSKNKKIKLSNWLLDIAACEIEQTLSFSEEEKFLLDYMAESIRNKVEIKERSIISFARKEDQKRQIYIACQKALFNLDQPAISYSLLKNKYPQWSSLSGPDLEKAAQDIYFVWKDLKKELNHPLKDKLYKLCQKYKISFLLIGEILAEFKGKLAKIYEEVSKPEKMEKLIKRVYQKRLLTLKKNLSRAASYSLLSVFFLKIFSFFILEIPLVKATNGVFTPQNITLNILSPVLLMFFLIALAKNPSKSNSETILLQTMKIIYKTEKKELYELKVPKKRNFLEKILVHLLYFLGFLFFLSAAIIIFRAWQLPLISIFINIIFLGLAVCLGLTVKEKGEEFSRAEEKKSTFLDFVFDILFLPIVNFSSWLSNKWKEYSLITTFLNALTDLPFRVFISFLGGWIRFLKEKKKT